MISVMQMKALVMESPGRLALRELPIPQREGECLVRVCMAGICGTDLQMLDGYAGFSGVPGHEFVGVVETAPEDDRAWIGRRVAGEINIGCGRCHWCAAGIKEHCLDRTVVGIRERDGAFAEYLSLPARNLHAIPAALADEAAVFVEPVAAACRILEQIAIDDRMHVAVLGDGRMGLLVAQVLKTVTPHVTLIGRHQHKLEVARRLDLPTALSDDLKPAERFDVVVDVTGRAEGLRRALTIVRPRGTVVMKSTFHGEAPIESWPIVVDEVTLVGSRCGPFDRAIALLGSGAVRVDPLIARVAPLDEHEAAVREARKSLKVLFAIDGNT
jgi:threonine dehydrogenase-like Zn-dependent dehydrogenase